MAIKTYHIFGVYKTKEKAKAKAKHFREEAHFRYATVHKVKGGYTVHASGYKP